MRQAARPPSCTCRVEGIKAAQLLAAKFRGLGVVQPAARAESLTRILIMTGWAPPCPMHNADGGPRNDALMPAERPRIGVTW